MAKESMKARERKRAKMVEKYAAKRAALKAAGDWDGLQKLPANSSKARVGDSFLLNTRVNCRYRKIPRITKKAVK